MLHGKLMIRANDRTLEQRPYVLKRVGMSKAAHVFAFAMVNRNMDCVVVMYADICAVLVSRNDFGFVRKLGFDKSADRFMTNMLSLALQANLAAAFNRTHDGDFATISPLGIPPPFVFLGHPSDFAANL